MNELQIISSVTGIPVSEILGKSRRAEIVEARHLLCFILSEKYTPTVIGKMINRNHSSIMHGTKKIKDFLEVGDKRTVELVNRIRDVKTPPNNERG